MNPRNIHISNIICIEQFIFRNIHIYVCVYISACVINISTYMHAMTNKEKEVINLKESEKGYMVGGKGRNKCCSYILISKKVCCFERMCIYGWDLNWPLWCLFVCLYHSLC